MPDINLLGQSNDEDDTPKRPRPDSEQEMSTPIDEPDTTEHAPHLPKSRGVFGSLRDVLKRPDKSDTDQSKEHSASPEPPMPKPSPPPELHDTWTPPTPGAVPPKQDFQPVPPVTPAPTPPGDLERKLSADAPEKKNVNTDPILEQKRVSDGSGGFLGRLKGLFAKKNTTDTPASGRSDTGSSDSFLDVNLIPGTMPETDLKKKYYGLALYVAVAVLVVVGVYGLLLWYESGIDEETRSLSSQIDAVEKDISALRDTQREALVFKSTTDQVNLLLDSHIYWTQFFGKLEDYTASDVYYTTFNASPSGDVSLTARGPDFSAPARQLLIFEAADDFVESVTITSATRTSETDDNGSETTGVSFTIQMKLVDGVFNRLGTGEGSGA